MIKAVIIDDEPAMQEINSRLLSEYFPNIEQLGTAARVNEGVALIKKHQPDLVLLDIELKDGSSFQLLQKLRPYNFKVVFITVFDSFAIRAIKFSATDYIVKPVNETEFQQAIQRAVELIKNEQDIQPQANVLMDTVKNEGHKKLVLRTTNSMHIVDVNDIYFCKSDNSYTTFFFEGGDKIMVSKSLKDYDNLLGEYSFFRPHQSYLVNLNHVKKIDKTDGGFIIMKNKKEIPVSSRQMKNLVRMLDSL